MTLADVGLPVRLVRHPPDLVHAPRLRRRHARRARGGAARLLRRRAPARVRRARAGPHRLPGRHVAALIGIPVTLGLGVFCVAGALAIGLLGKEIDEREIATGTILAFATGLGVLFSSLATREHRAPSRTCCSATCSRSRRSQLTVFALVTAGVAVVLAVIARPLTFASVDPQVAEAKGVPVKALGVVFLLLLALVVTMAVQVVGTLLLFALVVTPVRHRAARHAPGPRSSPLLGVGIGARVGVARPRAVGDVQPAAELLHRLDRRSSSWLAAVVWDRRRRA